MREVNTAVGKGHDIGLTISADRVWQHVPAAESGPVNHKSSILSQVEVSEVKMYLEQCVVSW